MHEQVIILTHYPHPGKVKTHLIPSVGAAVAAELHRKMTEHILDTVLKMRKSRRIGVIIGYSGTDDETMREWLGENFAYHPQPEGTLNDKLSYFLEVYGRQQFSTLIIENDCPDLSVQVLTEAFETLKTHDMVFGPTHDGGYYLIGMKQYIQEVLTDNAWQTHGVFKKIMEIVRQTDISCACLKQLHNVGHPDNLFLCEQYLSVRKQSDSEDSRNE
ncbi:TIGR04282 family arsenosugar biosynthesis glycosyltransferase [bacterium]|nr:TIGR04282 family arsenosugar biosynthesis glycosyltransferase [bacterium]MCP5461659.1 TIGR04282 family arsenosugar biosynthesis glycosyltransferase [bacterium]